MKPLLITLLSLVSALSFAAEPVKHVDAEAAAKLIADGKVTILDVRTSEEFKEGHLKNAKNIDITENDFETKLSALDKSQPVLVHCQAGGRSTRSLPTLEKLGFSLVYHLDGGYGGWVEAGKPVEKSE